MALVIEQQPGYKTLAAGQQVIVVVSEDTGIFTNEQMVRVNVSLNISRLSTGTGTVHTSTYSAIPNGQGVCIFDFGNVIENYVKPQYNGEAFGAWGSGTPYGASAFQLSDYTDTQGYHPIHNIDEYCLAFETNKYVHFEYSCEYLGGDGDPTKVETDPSLAAVTPILYIYNGLLYNTDVLKYPNVSGPDYGYDLAENGYIMDNKGGNGFLTDMPVSVYARKEDYGTMAFFNNLNPTQYSFETKGAPSEGVDYIRFIMYDSTGAVIGTAIDMENRATNGGWSGINPDPANGTFQSTAGAVRYLFAGVYPANLRGWNGAFQTAINNGTLSYYTFQAYNEGEMSQLYTVNLISECRYEPIRLAWVNKHGAWDYYTFMKKSTRTLSTKRTQYQKLDGTWNNSTYNLSINQGGRKSFTTNTTEKIRINTDYIGERDAVWLEQLQTSSEVLIMKDYFGGAGTAVIRRFNEPCTVTSASFVKKTVANDKLIQYTFEIEKAVEIKSQKA